MIMNPNFPMAFCLSVKLFQETELRKSSKCMSVNLENFEQLTNIQYYALREKLKSTTLGEFLPQLSELPREYESAGRKEDWPRGRDYKLDDFQQVPSSLWVG